MRYGGEIGLGLPAAGFSRRFHRLGEACEIFAPRDVAKTHVLPQRPDQLAVVESVAPSGQVPIEYGHADARRIRLVRELRFGGERGAGADPIAARDQRAGLVPDLEAVRVAGVER